MLLCKTKITQIYCLELMIYVNDTYEILNLRGLL